MKKFFVSVGLATAGAAAFQSSSMAQSSLLGSPKIWNVSAQLDGFYDDNYATSNTRKGSYGVEFSPTVSADLPLTQTELGIIYTYGVQWYDERSQLGQNAFDQDHSLSLWVDHSFNERWNVKVSDTFVDGQEPQLLNTVAPGGAPYRLNGNNIVNSGTVDLHTDWTRLFSTDLTYGSVFTDYSESGTETIPGTVANGNFYNVQTAGNAIGVPSYAGTLNRIQNSVDLDLQWHLAPQTIISAGYKFVIVNYTGNETIGYDNVADFVLGVPTGTYNGGKAPTPYYSDSRDNLSHIGYVGIHENLLASLVAAAQVGVQWIDDFNDPVHKTTSTEPYANLSLIYTYLPDCNLTVGFTQSRNSTDVATVSTVNGSITQDQESSTLYASINHHITPKLLVSAIGQWSSAKYNGGQYDGTSDTDYGLGLSANYAFTRNLSANVNYNYDDLSSSINSRAYSRNRISLGVSVSY
jgi:hypothetical protein